MFTARGAGAALDGGEREAGSQYKGRAFGLTTGCRIPRAAMCAPYSECCTGLMPFDEAVG